MRIGFLILDQIHCFLLFYIYIVLYIHVLYIEGRYKYLSRLHCPGTPEIGTDYRRLQLDRFEFTYD